ncbi:hypothetical protein BDFB_008392 [Asbolus verrucosus]|uniref:Uncharacterized protein n=1 Tax=Asbolus verrucosus TaxID=1661398 RepID=A0A482VIP8_ASBVE|nr:hypothetical protein BDFB_008392 [Asbolus verrucosus]
MEAQIRYISNFTEVGNHPQWVKVISKGQFLIK